MTEFFRHCPGCGRRFHIKLETKKLVDERKESTADQGRAISANPLQHRYASVYDSGPVIVDIRDFQYTYKCAHCGHEWTEKHERLERIN